ncbi:MAG: hypothetical protein CL853_02125 [Crocinitomicaceae bacterium]|nr:hypothetical protein [Crocinitomicaceae bacterium]|tara:strand:- start:2880 stop:4007 length:1128 start_codon:yes stop_codon:yes gene_type:complete
MKLFDYIDEINATNIILVCFVVVIWLLIRRLINRKLEPFLKRKDWLLPGKGKKIKTLLKQVLFLMFFIFGVKALSFGHANFSFKGILNTQLFNLGTVDTPIPFTFSSILFILIVFVFARFIVTLCRIFIHRSTKTRAWIDEGRRYTFIQVTKYFIYTIAIIVAIQGLGVDITLLIYGSTALFVGVGLGLQSVLGDMFSGIILLFDGSIKVGDIVELSDNEIAKVQNIYIRTSQLKTIDGKFVIVPNSRLTKENVTNLTISDKATRFHVKISVAYGTDTKKLKEILYECALQHPLVEKRRNIIVLFDDFGGYALEFRVYFWVKRTWEILNIKSDIRYIIDQRFRENGIKIPFPQRDLHLVSDQRNSDTEELPFSED